jgi:1,4-dihydroxy-2-naphthoate octaprenyltransferase
LAVIQGADATATEYGLLLAVAYLVPAILEPNGGGLTVLLPLLTIPLALPLFRTVRTFDEPRQLNPVLKATARLALVHGLLFALGLALWGTLS